MIKDVSMSSADLHGSGGSYPSGSFGQSGGANQIDNGTVFTAGARSISQLVAGVFGGSGSYAPSFAGFETGIFPPSPTINPIHTFADLLAEIVKDAEFETLRPPVTINDAFAAPDGKLGSEVLTSLRTRDIEKDHENSEGSVFPPLVATDQYDQGLTNSTPSLDPGISAPPLTATAISEPFTLPMFVAGFIGALIMSTHGRILSQFFSLLQLFKWLRNRLPDFGLGTERFVSSCNKVESSDPFVPAYADRRRVTEPKNFR